MQHDRPLHYPLGSSTAQLHQQELQLRQYTLAAMSARERDRERVRLSPEPHLEIMRPVSPFQNKRQMVHQQVQEQATAQTQLQNDQRLWKPPYQAQFGSQTYTHARPFRTQEASQSSVSTSSNSHSSTRAVHSNSRARQHGPREDSRGTRAAQRDVDISPALKMMNYDTKFTPPSSDQGHGQAAAGALNTAGTLAPPERDDLNRSTSPEGGRKRNPGWRKPVPKYIPTPPSTPPTATFDRLPSMRKGEEPIPPVPVHSNQANNARSNRPRASYASAQAEPVLPSIKQTPPARPARAATEHQVPVHFRDLTASRTRIAGIQQPAQVHARPTGTTRTPRTLTTPAQNTVQVSSHPLSQTSTAPRAQALAAPRAPPQAHLTHHDNALRPTETSQSDSTSLRPPDDQTETRRAVLVHPQPRKVPSMSKLVAMVLPSRSPSRAPSRSPSRTPSPGVHPTTREISGPLPLLSTPPAKAMIATSAETSQAAVPSLSVDPPSPIANKETPSATLSGALLHPEQIYLPPSGNSSARSSRSFSPQPSPRRATTPLPTSSRSASPQPSPRRATTPLPANPRSRSPTPAAIPQYAPPPPPFPPPPPNTPVAAPKRRASALLQPLLSSRFAEKAEAAAAQVKAPPAVTLPVANEAPEEVIVFNSTNFASRMSDAASSLRSAQAMQERNTPTGAQNHSGLVKDPKPLRQEREVMTHKAVREETVASANALDRHSLPQSSESSGAAKSVDSSVDVSPEDRMLGASAVKRSPSPRDLYRKAAHTHSPELKEATVEKVTVASDPQDRSAVWDLKREGTAPLKQIEALEKREERSPSPIGGRRTRPSEAHALATTIQEVRELDSSTEKKPTPRPVPMNTHSEISRESGLVTPPITPPGTLTSTVRDEHVQTKQEGGSIGEPSSNAERGQVTRSVRPVQPPPDDSSVAKSALRREALIQDERFQGVDEVVIDRAKSTARPITTFFTPESSPATSSVNHEETSTPPSKLPSDWKESITRAVRSNRTPSPPVLSRVEQPEGKSEIRPTTGPAEHSPAQTARSTEETSASRYVTRGVPKEQVEHATTALKLHVHEVETGGDIATSQVPEKKVIDTEEIQQLLSSKSPQHERAAPESASKVASAAKHQPNHDDLSLQSNSLDLVPPEVSVRSRSPVSRRKAPQRRKEEADVAQGRTDMGSVTAAAPEMPVPSSAPAVPPARQSPEPSSRSHSSGSKRKGKASRARSGGDGRNASTVQLDDLQFESVARYHDAEVSTSNEPPLPLQSQSSTNCVSPPPRYQSLGSRKRLPPNRSETNLAQPEEKNFALDALPSPSVPFRSLSPSTQMQPPPRPQRHPHGHHKRLQAPEVTQQTYRPPTPPIPSHYRKKRSNDLLPPEPPTFMKPAVHVIYPDTSASHGPSLSNDSVFNAPSPKPVNNKSRAQTAVVSTTMPFREDRPRPQSPSPSNFASEEQYEDEDDVPEISPQVPPKAMRTEVNKHDSPSSSDRLSDFTHQHATHGQVRYPSAPVGLSRAHIIMLPPNSNGSKNRSSERAEGSSESNQRSRRAQQPYATKAARSQSEKVLKNNDNVPPVARSRSTPIPSSRQRSRRGFWRIFGLWARVFMAKFKNWASPAPSTSQSSEYGAYYDAY